MKILSEEQIMAQTGAPIVLSGHRRVAETQAAATLAQVRKDVLEMVIRDLDSV